MQSHECMVVCPSVPSRGQAIKDGSFYHNKVLVEALQKAKAKGRLHLLGLVSDGGVHSHIEHLKHLLMAAQQAGVRETYLHFFADGRGMSIRHTITAHTGQPLMCDVSG